MIISKSNNSRLQANIYIQVTADSAPSSCHVLQLGRAEKNKLIKDPKANQKRGSE